MSVPASKYGGYDQMDPHGAHQGHHHHVILGGGTLLAVLAALLAFTFLTVGATKFEEYLIYDMGIPLPGWVNIVVALGIAVVKSTLVALFFMQLKYDNPINALIFCSCLFAVGLFLGFTTLDLGSRDAVYEWKSGQIQAGGQGVITTGESFKSQSYATGGKPIVLHARENAITLLGMEEFLRQEAEAHAHYGHHAAHTGPASTPNYTRPRTGPTPGLFDADAPAHGDDHADHDAPAHHAEDEAREPNASGGH